MGIDELCLNTLDCIDEAKNINKENDMDKIERYVYNWIFELQEKVNLQKRLEEIGKILGGWIKSCLKE